MTANGCIVMLLATLFVAAPAHAASTVVLQKGDGDDQVLTVSTDDGSPERAMTLICEPSENDYGVVLLAPGLSAKGLRITADGAPVSLGSPLGAGDSVTFMIEGKTDKNRFMRVLAARVVQVEAGALRLRFALGDGASEVVLFRQLCRL